MAVIIFSKINKLIYTLGKIAIWLLGLQFLTVIILAVVAQIILHTADADLPNGLSLAPTNFNRKQIQLLDENGKQAVPPNIIEVLWCRDYVYGYIESENAYHEKSASYFVYKKGWSKPDYYRERDKYISYVREQGWVEPNYMNEQKYKDLSAEAPISKEFCSS